MKNPLVVGVTAGVALSTWSVLTMLMPVSYGTWNTGRSVLFVGFIVALTRLAVSRARVSAVSTFGAVAVACLVAAAVSLAAYAMSTDFFAHRIVQLPEYLRDYTYHGYTSPAVYLATNGGDLIRLQLFSWGITVVGLVIITGTAGLLVGRHRLQTRTA